MFQETEVPSSIVSHVSFGLYGPHQIRKLSVKEITNPQTFDALLHPTFGGLYDPALGPQDRDDLCTTCGQGSLLCPGHMGHITLPLPVYNPLLFNTMVQLLRRMCFECHHLMVSAKRSCALQYQLEALDLGQVTVAYGIEELYSQSFEEKWEFDELKQKCSQTIQDIVQDTKISTKKSNIKQVVECRNQLLKNLLRGVIGEKKRCPHCNFVNKNLRTQHHSKIFFTSGLSLAQARKAVVKSINAKKELRHNQRSQSSIDGDAEEVIMEEEYNKEVDAETEIKNLMDKQEYLTPTDTQQVLRKLWFNEKAVLGRIFPCLTETRSAQPTDAFFLEVIPVPPSRFRPISVLKDKRFENPQTANLARVLNDCWSIRDILSKIKSNDPSNPDPAPDPTFTALPGSTPMEKLQGAWLRLQTHVNCLLDKDLDKLSTDGLPGVKQLLEKKEGLFRMHMMGKRVNFAARTVISPDPYIATNEIGIPDVFARKLTYPQPVTAWNFTEMKQAVINGPKVHPGATIVENEDGKRILLSGTDRTQREAIAKQLLTPSANAGPDAPNKKVFRHLRNGDFLLLNRQPSLHRPSIQAHKARILPHQKTLRLHYSNCKAYNADFDGDEMNAHLVQNELARAEAYCLASTDYQYLTPKDGTPLAGLIQDHMVSGVSLTIRGRHFTRADYQQLVYAALTDKPGPVKLLPPCILKPQVYWSGKQVFSTVLLNIIPRYKPAVNLTGNAKISSKSWNEMRPSAWVVGGTPLVGDVMTETEVVIRQGELLVGVLDKAHYGPTSFGLVHACYELYGGEMAGTLLTCLGKLFTTFLQYRGFTLGVEDILVQSSADHKRRKVMRRSTKCGAQVAAKALGVADPGALDQLYSKLQQARFAQDDGDMKDLDLSMKSETDKFQNDISKACMGGLYKKFPLNNLQLMVQSGAKGSMVNCMQISSLLGQIELEGRRPPVALSGRSLPSFQCFDMTPRSRGFIAGRFLTGIRPQEYFFHCMAGREGLVDTAVKTSRSGYLQRCLIKHLEGLTVNYDLTVRDSDGSMVQFQYGEDGLDISRTPYLGEKQFPFLLNNSTALISHPEKQHIHSKLDTSSAAKLWSQEEKWNRKKDMFKSKVRSSPFLQFCGKKWSRFIEEYPELAAEGRSGRRPASTALCTEWLAMDPAKRSKYEKHKKSAPDPVLAQLHPGRNLGVISNRFRDVLTNYLAKNPHQLITSGENKSLLGSCVSEDEFHFLMNARYMKALVPPGEAVGLLAAQSIGEPSTQMTLNTFHFAGRGEMNVTLGIPRLREILMVASANIRTPAMDIPVLDVSHARKRATRLQRTLNKIHLSQVLEDVKVTETLSVKSDRENMRLYCIRFNFLPRELYQDQCQLTPQRILDFMENYFIKHLCFVSSKRMAEMEKTTLLNMARVRVRTDVELQKNSSGVDAAAAAAAAAGDDDVVDDDQHDGDATADKTRQRQQEEQDYLGEEAEMEEAGLGQEADSDVEAPEMADISTPPQHSEDETPTESKDDITIARLTPKLKKKKSHDAETDMIRAKRITTVLGSAHEVFDYNYDTEDQLWCQVTLRSAISSKRVDMASVVEVEANKVIVTHCPGISRCFLSDNKDTGLLHIKTEGVNMQDMYLYQDVLDLSRLYTNDVHAMAHTYGIEAACRVITKEVKDVFGAYGITVDSRHLSLVADYMTCEGRYKAFNRLAVESNASPFQKMSFETTMHFLRTATVQGSSDDLQSPSARLVVGRLVKGGTGCFDVLAQPI